MPSPEFPSIYPNGEAKDAKKIPSPVEGPIAEAEEVITKLVSPDTKGAAWDPAEGGWVVGSNVAESGDAHLLVTQALGPNGQVEYAANVGGQKIAWRQGAERTGDLRYGHDRDSSAYSDNRLALSALSRIIDAHQTSIKR